MSASSGSWFDRSWRALLLGLMTLFVINIGLMIAAVAVSSFARRWLGTWLPEGWTTTWYSAAWKEFQLGDVLTVTVQVVLTVVLLSGVTGAHVIWLEGLVAAVVVRAGLWPHVRGATR